MESLSNEIQNNVQVSQPEDLAQSLIRVNQLSYRMPSNMSVVVSRSMKRSFANLEAYNQGGKIIITWNTGAEYVNGLNSYLVFDAKVDAGEVSFGSGSACNFIDNVTVTSMQGTEIDRTEGVNAYVRDMDRHTYSQEWINNFGTVMGYNSTEVKDEEKLSTSEKRFCIPLSKLAGVCNTGVLLPSMLAGGLRWEIKLSDLFNALKQVSGTTTKYTLTNVSMMLDTYQLADSIQKRLMQEASTTGLEFYYVTYDRTRHNINASDKANITVRKSVARALNAFAKTRLTDKVVSNTADSMESEPNKVRSFFWRLGALNFPNERLFSKEEHYYYAQYVMNKTQEPFKMNSVSLNDFKGTEGIISVNLERSSVLNLSGLPVNNSRTLQVEIDYDEKQSRDIDVYMHYLQLARVFVNNILVKE